MDQPDSLEKLGTYTKPNRRGSENILDKVGSVWNNKDLVESLYLDRGKKAGTSVMIVGYNPTLDIEEKNKKISTPRNSQCHKKDGFNKFLADYC